MCRTCGPTSKPTTNCWRPTLADPKPRGGSPPAALRILGLDPGSRYTGWGIVDRQGSRLSLVGQGRIVLPAQHPLPDRLRRLGQEMDDLLARYQPQAAVLESLFRGVNVRSLIVLAQARGALITTVARAGVEIHEYTPSEIKSAVAGSGRADKTQVARMVTMILGCRSALTPDAADALAAAICYSQRSKLDRLGASRGPLRTS